ncbi:MAG: hypothetical protein COU29_04270 [Candidatus Magasanikbacteria bacterium CG10_big_fil_rev_8_21_14_0_10_36_32]|uniref:Sphingomyelin synthase-like domain-containing protein n=1 Tax=Candidatus Magasanikbacteria bacterium CG10_big_fil_rev_8_21_14_0_10_36_32 TaxID=1974646 RepID=A0A2M6W5L0_9BACT|nr:MAG: hypothetical protein COU29_04270 [Candidatus Magasanikbacteria bacterium CG10_big_fil_rev_8_21_14_0_10_36_32]
MTFTDITPIPEKQSSLLRKWPHKELALSIISAVLLFIVSLVINHFAGSYATARAGNHVRDIILDNIPTINVSGIFIYGFAIFFIFVVVLMFWKPRLTPFILKSLSLFIIIRSFFICLTHIGPQPQMTFIPSGSIANLFTFTGDLFFSAHTGLPFLMALIFLKNKYLRSVFLIFSLLFGTVVLLGHYHYSIDVFSAFFITYGIYHIAKWLFKKDYNYTKI